MARILVAESCPVQVEIGPAVGKHQLDHARHDQQAERGKARSETDDQQHRKHDLGDRRLPAPNWSGAGSTYSPPNICSLNCSSNRNWCSQREGTGSTSHRVRPERRKEAPGAMRNTGGADVPRNRFDPDEHMTDNCSSLWSAVSVRSSCDASIDGAGCMSWPTIMFASISASQRIREIEARADRQPFHHRVDDWRTGPAVPR